MTNPSLSSPPAGAALGEDVSSLNCISSFDAGWEVRPKVSLFAQIAGRPSGQRVRLPHDAIISLERSPQNPAAQAYFPGGVFEYSKAFDVPDSWRYKRVAVEFDGVYRDAVVFINDAVAAQRPYGYSAFTVELTPFLRFGEENTIRVEARSSKDSRWYTGSGIYRHTRLVVSDLIHIAPNGVRVNTPDIDDDRAVVDVAVLVRNLDRQSSTVRLEVSILDPSGEVVAHGSLPVTTVPQETDTARVRLYVYTPQLWDVDSPTLYTALVTLHGVRAVEEIRTTFGIRSLQLDTLHGLRINGDSVKLRGACIHSDNGILGAAAIARADERRIEQLKAAGFNAIRSAHNPLSAAMLDACDRVGMLVMDEAFDVWTELKTPEDYTLRFNEWWERDIEAMVGRDFNHPSVIFYSLGNEIFETGDPHGSRLGRRLAEKVRSLDSTRFVTGGVNGLVSTLRELAAAVREAEESAAIAPAGINALMADAGSIQDEWYRTDLVSNNTEESYAVLDVAGMNYSESRYDVDEELFPERIIVSTETFARKIAPHWANILANPKLLGDFTWTGYDYLGEVGIGRLQYPDDPEGFEGPYPWIAAWCGDLDLTGFRRPQSYYREIVFGLRSEPYIAVQRPELYGRPYTSGQWSWTDAVSSWTWDAPEGAAVHVEVYADADEVELFLDEIPLGRARVGQRMPLVAEFDTTYRRGVLTAIAYRNGQECGRHTIASATGPIHVNVTADRHEIENSTADLAFFSIEMRDAEGVVDTTIERTVTVSVEGAGVLQAFGSARPRTEERYDSLSHHAFDGRALLVVRPTEVGRITVRATVEGLPEGTETVQVTPAPASGTPAEHGDR